MSLIWISPIRFLVSGDRQTSNPADDEKQASAFFRFRIMGLSHENPHVPENFAYFLKLL
jgi:hypothetical protein